MAELLAFCAGGRPDTSPAQTFSTTAVVASMREQARVAAETG